MMFTGHPLISRAGFHPPAAVRHPGWYWCQHHDGRERVEYIQPMDWSGHVGGHGLLPFGYFVGASNRWEPIDPLRRLYGPLRSPFLDFPPVTPDATTQGVGKGKG